MLAPEDDLMMMCVPREVISIRPVQCGGEKEPSTAVATKINIILTKADGSSSHKPAYGIFYAEINSLNKFLHLRSDRRGWYGQFLRIQSAI